MRILRLPALALVVTAIACGGASDAVTQPNTPMSFSATINGDITAKVRGDAFYLVGAGVGGLHLESDDQSTFRILIDHTGSLTIGTHQVTDSDVGTFGALTDTEDGALRVWLFDGGTLTIDSMRNDVITGTFNVTAYEAPAGSRRVTVEGSFSAKVAQVVAP